MSLEGRLAAAFGLDKAGHARHANPWGGWSHALSDLPVLVRAALSWLAKGSVIDCTRAAVCRGSSLACEAAR